MSNRPNGSSYPDIYTTALSQHLEQPSDIKKPLLEEKSEVFTLTEL